FFQAEDGIRDLIVTGVQTCALPIFPMGKRRSSSPFLLRIRWLAVPKKCVAGASPLWSESRRVAGSSPFLIRSLGNAKCVKTVRCPAAKIDAPGHKPYRTRRMTMLDNLRTKLKA